MKNTYSEIVYFFSFYLPLIEQESPLRLHISFRRETWPHHHQLINEVTPVMLSANGLISNLLNHEGCSDQYVTVGKAAGK